MNAKHNQMTIGEIPEYFGGKFNTKKKVAVKSDDGFTITWEQLNKRSNQLARVVKEDFNLDKGDVVITFLNNCGQYPEIIYGLSKAGVIIAPTSFRFFQRELQYAIEHSDAKAIIVSENLYYIYQSISDEVQISKKNILIVGRGTSSNYEKLLKGKEDHDIKIQAEESDYMWLGLTGGTTGNPKAALTTHRTLIENWKRMTIEFGVLEDDYELISGPFHHGLGFLFGLQQLSVGGTIFITEHFDAQQVLTIIESEKITATPMVPTMYNEILNIPNKDDFDISSIRVLVSAGSALLTKLKEEVMEYFPEAGLYEYYGSTEHGFYTIIKPEDQIRKNRSCGQPFYGMKIRVLDDEGNEVKQGEIGEIYKKGLLLGAEYYKNKEATEQCFRGEWASSGDMGYVDKEGFLYIADRKKDMLISGGINIYPTEIEEVIQSHPSVREVAVVGLPDEKWGEAVSAFIVLKKEHKIDKLDILSFCNGQIADYKKPKNIFFIEELPKTVAGKILRRKIKEISVKSNV